MAFETEIRAQLSALQRQQNALAKQVKRVLQVVEQLEPAQIERLAQAQMANLERDPEEAERRFYELTGEEPPASGSAGPAEVRLELVKEREPRRV